MFTAHYKNTYIVKYVLLHQYLDIVMCTMKLQGKVGTDDSPQVSEIYQSYRLK